MKPRTLFSTKTRFALVGLAACAVVAGIGVGAHAAFTTQTTSAQQVSAGTYHWTVSAGVLTSSSPTALYPGTAPQVFTFTVTDTGTLHEVFVSSDLSVTVTSGADAACPATDFLTSIDTHTASGTTLAPGGSFPVTVSVSLTTSRNTSGCEATSPTVTLTITATD